MAQEFIANEDYVITITPNGGWTPGPAAGHNYIEQKSTKTKMNSKFVLQTPLAWTANGCTLAGYTHTSGGGTINATATKSNWEVLKSIRENDQGTCNGIFTKIPPPPGVTLPCSCTFKISSAGQLKAKGE